MAGAGEEHIPNPEHRLLLDALNARMERMMREHSENVNERMERLLERRGSDDEYSGNEERRRDRRRRRENDRNRREDRMEGVKLSIPTFQGRSDPEAYQDWEKKIEQLFACHEYSEERKVRLAAMGLTDYALVWWDQIQRDRRRNEEPEVDNWMEMRRALRRRFIPSHYQNDIRHKLVRLTQGEKSVDEYFKEMEMYMIRANVIEERAITMARFVQGLNSDIRDVVELQSYRDLEDVMHLAIKVEQQLKRKGLKKSSTFNSSSWKEKNKKEGTTSSSNATTGFQRTSFKSNEVPKKIKSSEIKCFKCLGRGHIASECPTKKTMLLKENGNITSESSQSESSSREGSEDEGEEIPGGDLFVVRRMLGGMPKGSEESQRENIFHTRCLIQGKVCSLIIDGGSCTNVAGSRLVTRMNLETKPHPRPYKLQWLSENEN